MNILIRTSDREYLFKRCVDSIVATGKPVKLIVSADTPNSIEYAHRICAASGLPHKIMQMVKQTGYGYWNLYLNKMLSATKGWVLILDDDKTLLSLDIEPTDTQAIYIYKAHYVNRELPEPQYWGTITECHIDMANFVFHTNNLNIKFDGKGRGDYRFVKRLSAYRKPIFINKTIVMIDQVNRGKEGFQHPPLNIEFVVPYAFDKNIGREYNEIFERSTADYICIMDGDIMFFDNDFGHFISEAISRTPGGGIYTCLTNRIGNPEQRFQGRVSPNANILMHKNTSDKLRKKYGYKMVRAKQRTSMLMSVIPKKVWEEFKFIDGLLNVDWDFSSRVMKKYPIYIMQGLYVFHLYRLGDGGVGYTKHLQ